MLFPDILIFRISSNPSGLIQVKIAVPFLIWGFRCIFLQFPHFIQFFKDLFTYCLNIYQNWKTECLLGNKSSTNFRFRKSCDFRFTRVFWFSEAYIFKIWIHYWMFKNYFLEGRFSGKISSDFILILKWFNSSKYFSWIV